MRTTMITMLFGLALLAPAPYASAFGPGGGGFGGRGHGGPGGMPLRILLAQMDAGQRAQVRQILIADRGTMRDTVTQLHQAQQALADKMFAAGDLTQADVEPQLQKIAALHQQLLEHGASIMLKVRAIAKPEQLAKAAQTKQQMDQLHAQMRALLGTPGAGAGAAPTDPMPEDDLPE